MDIVLTTSRRSFGEANQRLLRRSLDNLNSLLPEKATRQP